MSTTDDKPFINKKRERQEEDKPESRTKLMKNNPRKYLEKLIVDSEKKMIKEIEKKSDAGKGAANRTNFDNKSETKLSTVTKATQIEIKEKSNVKKISEPKLIMDELGRVVDEKGNIIQIKPESKSTLKININKEKEVRVKELLRTQKIDSTLVRHTGEKFFDSNLESIKKRREKMKMHAFNFAEQGTYVKNAEEMRKRQNAKELGIDLNSTELTAEEEKDLINLDLLHIRPNFNRQPLKLMAYDLIPDIEWWDAYFLPPDKKSFSPYWIKDNEGNWIHNTSNQIKFEDFNLNEDSFLKNKVTQYIQHPVPIKNDVIEKSNKVNLPVFLTQKEKKKLKRLRRLEKEKEKQEKMKLGLIKPPPPKLKFNNFMRILGDQAIQDPSQVEKLVRKAYEERYTKMMKENEARKLTKEQKADKKKRKYERDSKKEVKACLFKIENLCLNKARFKIDRNCQQLYLTGVCIMFKKKSNEKLPNLVYVEGGPLAIKKFKNLLLRRIKWKSDQSKVNNENSENNDNNDDDNEIMKEEDKNEFKIKPECLLVWEGILKKRYYEKWKMTEIKNENDVRKILAEKGIEHFWNLLLSYKIDDN